MLAFCWLLTGGPSRSLLGPLLAELPENTAPYLQASKEAAPVCASKTVLNTYLLGRGGNTPPLPSILGVLSKSQTPPILKFKQVMNLQHSRVCLPHSPQGDFESVKIHTVQDQGRRAGFVPWQALRFTVTLPRRPKRHLSW